MREYTDFESFLKKILKEATGLINAEAASIFLLEDNNLVLKTTIGFPKKGKTKTLKESYKIGEGFTGKVFLQAKPMIYQTSQDFYKSFIHASYLPVEKINSVLVVPIFSEDEVIGVIRCMNKISGEDVSDANFTDEDVKTLEIFAKTASAAIEAKKELIFTTTAPYVFVLIPFRPDFKDIYELGIKDVVESLKMRCEKVDEIEFSDSILHQIYKGIQSADVIISDMTGRNPNVFYETGYAHALKKEVIILTQDVTDIPFDLKLHNHIIYEGKITFFREKLEKRLKAWFSENWNIEMSSKLEK